MIYTILLSGLAIAAILGGLWIFLLVLGEWANPG